MNGRQRFSAALQTVPLLTDVNSDQQNKGLETDLVIDRDTAARLGLSAAQIDNTLYDAFGQRQVSTIYSARNQYHVIMEVAPQYLAGPGNAQRCLCQHGWRFSWRRAADQRRRGHGQGATVRRRLR